MKIREAVHLTRYQLLVTVFLFWGTFPLILGNAYLALMGAVMPTWRCNETQPFTDDCSVLESCNGTAEFQNIYLTFADEFGLYCDHAYLNAAVGTIQNIGFIVGCLIFGQLCDTYGRKPLAIACISGAIVAGVASTFCHNFIAFCAFRVVALAFGGGLEVTKHTMLMEIIEPRHRMLVLAFFWFSGGSRALVAALMHVTGSWRSAMQIINGCSVVSLGVVYCWVHESPKWLAQRNRFDDVNVVLAKIAKFNGQPAPNTETLLRTSKSLEAEAPSRNYTYMDLFIRKSLIFRTFLTSLFYFAVCMVTSGFDFSSGALSGDFVLNQILLGVISQVVKPLAFVLDTIYKRFNRRLLQQASMGIVVALIGTTAVLMAVGKEKYGAVTAGIAISGRIILEWQWDAVYLYAIELFPTALRAIGMSFAQTVGRGGDALGPVIAYIGLKWASAPFFIYASVGAVSVLVSCAFAPDTKGIDLPDTIEMKTIQLG